MLGACEISSESDSGLETMTTEFADDDLSQRNRLAIFDCDGVLAYRKGSWTTIHEKMGTTDHQREHFELYQNGEVDMKEWSRITVEQWGGRRVGKFREAMNESTPIDGLEPAIRSLRNNGFIIGIVSAGVLQYVESLVEDVPIDFIISNYIDIEDGHLTGESDIHVTDLNKKDWFEDLVERYDVEKSNVALIGDSEHDLQKVHPDNLAIAFNPESCAAVKTADVVIEDGDLELILEPINEWVQEQLSSSKRVDTN